MLARTTTTFGALALLLNALAANAFQVESGTACSGTGSCSYYSDNSSAGGSADTLVEGFCAPDGVCASNGATCQSDDQCYNYCGSDGTCGGAGAGCNTQNDFEAGQPGIACGSDFTCSANGSVGQCISSISAADADADAAPAAGASQLSTRRNKRRMDSSSSSYHHRQVRSSDLRLNAGKLGGRSHL